MDAKDLPHTISVRTALTDNGFMQEIDMVGAITRKVTNVVALQADNAFRAKLIELGWTPPPEPKLEIQPPTPGHRPWCHLLHPATMGTPDDRCDCGGAG